MLGSEFANCHVIVEQISPFEIRVRKARVIPEAEAWLWEGKNALGMVKRGLEQAKAQKFSKSPPDLAGDESLIKELDDRCSPPSGPRKCSGSTKS